MSAPVLSPTPALTPRWLRTHRDGQQDWAVASASRPHHEYVVTVGPDGAACDCPNHTFRQRWCKHIEAVLIAAKERPMSVPTGLVSYQSPSLPALPDSGEWGTIVQMSKVLAASGLMPAHIRTPEAAAAIILQGRELSIGAMQALRTINLIKGRLTLAADLMAALIYARCGDRALQVVERTAERCVIDYQRPGWSAPARMVWTMDMAKRAKLTGGDNWQHYPEAMLYARCVSAIGHTAFQDVIMGLYTADEVEEIADREQSSRPVVTLIPPADDPDADTVPESAADLSGKADTETRRARPANDRSIRDQAASGQQKEDIKRLVKRLGLAWLQALALAGIATDPGEHLSATQAAQIIKALERKAAETPPHPTAAALAAFWQAIKMAGWDVEDVHQASRDLYGREADQLTAADLATFHAVMVEGRVQLDPLGKYVLEAAAATVAEPTEEAPF